MAMMLQQPWAELLLDGVTVIDFRPVLTDYRGRVILVTSTVRDTKVWARTWSAIHGPKGAVVGVATLADVRAVKRGDAVAAGRAAEVGDFAWCLEDVQRIGTVFDVRASESGLFELGADAKITVAKYVQTGRIAS